MASVEELRIRLCDLGFRILQMPPEQARAGSAAAALKRYLRLKRGGLAAALEIEAEGDAVLVRARGEAPGEMLRELRELIAQARVPEVDSEIEVDPEEFAIELGDVERGPELEREIARSRVRYFPHPTCEWFEISTGELLLTNRLLTYTPEWNIMPDDAAQKEGQHIIPLDRVLEFRRGEWWDVPCLMVELPEITYRYGWPAERTDLDTIFDVDEWLMHLRNLSERAE